MNDWATIPRFEGYEVNRNGQIRNKTTKQILKTWGKGRGERRLKIELTDNNGSRRKVTLSRVVCAAKEGRWPEDYEHTCHIDGDCLNDTMDNLRFADVINNAIDEVECGKLTTSKEYVELAIHRLNELLKTL
jgi:hypothetical protein